MYIGNLERRKGTDILLEAYRIYRECGGKRRLLIGGNIREKKVKYLLTCCSADFPELRYLGYVEEKRKYDLLSSCACFLFPSCAEGFGIPPLEALAYGKPVITSSLPVFLETLPMPVTTFSFNNSRRKQAEELAGIMLRENWKVQCQIPELMIEKLYGADMAGERLAGFF